VWSQHCGLRSVTFDNLRGNLGTDTQFGRPNSWPGDLSKRRSGDPRRLRHPDMGTDTMSNMGTDTMSGIPIGNVVEVGTPVARRPPHRSRRAVFPHRALHVNSLTHTPTGWPKIAEKSNDPWPYLCPGWQDRRFRRPSRLKPAGRFASLSPSFLRYWFPVQAALTCRPLQSPPGSGLAATYYEPIRLPNHPTRLLVVASSFRLGSRS
jgi:hypothetical protein